jgi:hypothetical protein
MRHSITAVTALMIVATLGVAAAQSQSPAPPAQQKENPLPGSPEHQEQVDRALHSGPGRAGNEEPLPPQQSDNSAFVNGALNVPGAPKDSQTVPAKFSARNATLDKLPTNATPLWLNDEQRAKIAATLRSGGTPAAATDAHLADPVPPNVELRELPDALKRDIPDVNKLKYLRTDDRILLVDPPNRTVVGEIRN